MTSAPQTFRVRVLVRVAVGVTLALSLVELGVRNLYTLRYDYDPQLGFVHAAGTRRWGREGFATSQWQEHNIRRRTPLDPGRPTVAVLGDSFTEALQVSDDEVFTARVERALAAEGKAVQFANLGRSTQSLADYIAHARYYRKLVSQTWTVVQLRLDDLTTDARYDTRPHFSDDGGAPGVVDVVPPNRTDSLWRARQRSMLVGYAFVRLGEFRSLVDLEPPLFRAGTPRRPIPPPPDSTYPIEAELDLLQRAYENRVTALVLPPYDVAAPMTETEVEARVRAHCNSVGLSCVSIRPGFQRLHDQGLAPYGFSNSHFGDGHLNAEGHALAAEALHVELAKVHAVF